MTTTTTKQYTIQSGDNFIAGFNRQHQIVQIAVSANNAKRFRNEAAAQKWAEKYANAGFGLATFRIVAL